MTKNKIAENIINQTSIPDSVNLGIVSNYLGTRIEETEFHHREIMRLRRTLSHMSAKGKSFRDTETQIVFEVASKLQEILVAASNLFISDDKSVVDQQRYWEYGFNPSLEHAPLPQMPFDDVIEILVDDITFKNKHKNSYRKAKRKLGKLLENPTAKLNVQEYACLLYTSPSPRDLSTSRMPSSA